MIVSLSAARTARASGAAACPAAATRPAGRIPPRAGGALSDPARQARAIEALAHFAAGVPDGELVAGVWAVAEARPWSQPALVRELADALAQMAEELGA